MKIITHEIDKIKIAEIIFEQEIFYSSDDATDLLGDLYYQGYEKIIIYEKNISSEFFDLKNKIAGEILQKYSNYRVHLAIVGDFNKYTSKSVKDFIFESNKIGHINFVSTVSDAISRLTKIK